MASFKVTADTSAIREELYPLVKESLNKSITRTKYKKIVNDFIANRSTSLYDTLPCDRIICTETEMDKIFIALDIDKKTVKNVINDTYWGAIENFRPLACKHEFTILMMCVIRYFMTDGNDRKMAELAMLHLSFSGKFYPSLHYRSYPTVTPVRHIMEYVVNNTLSKKFDLTTYGSVFGAIRSVGCTWLDTYKDKFKKFEDEDVWYLVQQLYSRIGSFTKNIATEYYEAYENGDYIAYSSDSYDPDDFHLADSDSLKVSKYTEKTMNYINSIGIDYRLAKMCSNTDITPNEVKAVIESIIGNKDNTPEIKELIGLMIALYFVTGERDVSDIKFITFTIAPKPNAKQKEIIRLKEIIENWLCESGTAYMRRRSRDATRNSYERAVRAYFAISIHNANR